MNKFVFYAGSTLHVIVSGTTSPGRKSKGAVSSFIVYKNNVFAEDYVNPNRDFDQVTSIKIDGDRNLASYLKEMTEISHYELDKGTVSSACVILQSGHIFIMPSYISNQADFIPNLDFHLKSYFAKCYTPEGMTIHNFPPISSIHVMDKSGIRIYDSKKTMIDSYTFYDPIALEKDEVLDDPILIAKRFFSNLAMKQTLVDSVSSYKCPEGKEDYLSITFSDGSIMVIEYPESARCISLYTKEQLELLGNVMQSLSPED